MNAGVSSEKENAKQSQSVKRVTPSPDTPSGAGLGTSQVVSFPFAFIRYYKYLYRSFNFDIIIKTVSLFCFGRILEFAI